VTKQNIDIDRELAGQGAAALATACIAPVVPSGSVSRSMMTLREGGRTRLAAAISGVVALVAALSCGPLLNHLPLAALAAGVIAALVPLLSITPLRRAWKVSIPDGIAGLVTLGATLILAPRLVEGLLIGIGICLLLFLRQMMRPQVVHLSLYPDGSWRDAQRYNLPLSEEIVILRPQSRLSFVSAASIEDDVLACMAKYPRLRLLVLAADRINAIDASGVEVLLRIHERATANKIAFAIAGTSSAVTKILERADLPKKLWTQSQYPTVSQAVSVLSQDLQIGHQPWDPQGGP
jgi:SulP family sulfate permease